LELLEPTAETQLMMPAGKRQPIFVGKDISPDRQVTAIVASCETDLRLRIGSCTPSDHYGTNAQTGKKSGDAGRRSARSGFAGEIVSRSREAETCRVQERRGKDVCLFEADDLFAQVENVRAVRIHGSCSDIAAVVNGINRRQSVSRRESQIET
jgi:hypothetical protein